MIPAHIFITITIAIFVFLIIYLTTFHHHTKSEKFNTNISDALEKVYGEINDNVDDFNKTNIDVNNAISTAFNSVYEQIDSAEKKNIKTETDVSKKLTDYQTTISNMKNDYVRNADLTPYELTSDVLSKIETNNTTYVDNTFVKKIDADRKYATSQQVTQVITEVKDNDIRVDNISNRTSNLDKLLKDEYASVDWCRSELVTKTEFDYVKAVQDNMPKKYTSTSELAAYKDKTQQDILNLQNGIGNFKTYSDNTYATQTSLKDEVNTFTPLSMHTKVADTVNNTLITLNTALLKTIENNADAATFTKIQQYEESIQNSTDAVNEMQKQMEGITANSIARDVLVLGNFKLSGVEQDNNYIKVFNKEGTKLSGGMMLANMDTKNLNVKSIASFDGEMKLGNVNTPMYIGGSANVNLKKGTFVLGDVAAKHQINGTLDVNNIITQNIQVGNRKLDIGDLVQKIKILDDRISNIEKDH